MLTYRINVWDHTMQGDVKCVNVQVHIKWEKLSEAVGSQTGSRQACLISKTAVSVLSHLLRPSCSHDVILKCFLLSLSEKWDLSAVFL